MYKTGSYQSNFIKNDSCTSHWTIITEMLTAYI